MLYMYINFVHVNLWKKDSTGNVVLPFLSVTVCAFFQDNVLDYVHVYVCLFTVSNQEPHKKTGLSARDW